jgi:hypothetical protein
MLSFPRGLASQTPVTQPQPRGLFEPQPTILGLAVIRDKVKRTSV